MARAGYEGQLAPGCRHSPSPLIAYAIVLDQTQLWRTSRYA